MSSPKSGSALAQLGRDVRAARIRRRITAADLAGRAGTSPNTIGRLEKGDRGVGIGTLADVLVVLGLIARLSDLLDLRHDELGLALTDQQTPQRARPRRSAGKAKSGAHKKLSATDPDGAAF
ncbi:helix-turn-helix domain-containing protein [Hyphomonas polymorpha]|uniref:helix-turn-helix domain-containing protein n=1 Tax=Hyphomonas polymorpha TaxID=74319 RepID=UPI0005532FD9|nr:helix-turn-helix transcriptional regulator [Hyphomonas polymorpha]